MQKKDYICTHLQPWVVVCQHKETLQRIQLVALGRCPEEAKNHVKNTIPKNNVKDFEFVDTMIITNKNFVCLAPCLYPEHLNIVMQ